MKDSNDTINRLTINTAKNSSSFDQKQIPKNKNTRKSTLEMMCDSCNENGGRAWNIVKAETYNDLV